jgi:non-specific serine/threonine protein kinase
MRGSTYTAYPDPVNAHRAALPAPLTPLVGREREVAAACRALRREDVRLLTLLGPPGVGKTRLAQALAARVAGDVPGGVWLVPLAPVADAALVLPTIARALGLVDTDPAGLPLRERLAARLRGAAPLLVLDNVEHLLPAAGAEVAGLLGACPDLTVVATSRTALRLSGEHRFPVPPLALPATLAPGSQPPVEEVAAAEAVRLFVARARAVRPDFALTAANAAPVVEVCARLDGLPLAIELVAARVSLLPPRALREQLSERGLSLLTGGAEDLPARQRTLRGAIAWSHDLLAPAEQALFRRLGVFAGGFTLEAAGAVAAGAPAADILDGLASLVDKSLVGPPVEAAADGAGDAGETRYGLLETLREFALERLEQSGEGEAVRRRHGDYFLALAEAAGPEVSPPGGAGVAARHDRLGREHANLRQALRWWEARARAGEAEPGLRLAGALWPFWLARGHRAEGHDWLQRFLALDTGPGTPARAAALYGAGYPAWNVGDPERAQAIHEEHLALCRALGDRPGEARALVIAGFLAAWRDDHEGVRASAAAGLALAEAAGDGESAAWAHMLLSGQALRRGDLEQAEARAREALRLFRQLDAAGAPASLTSAHLRLAELAGLRGDAPRAEAHYAEGLRLARLSGGPGEQGRMLRRLGHFALHQGDLPRAAALLGEAVDRLRAAGALHNVPACLVGLAGVAAAQGDAARAARLCGAATAVLEARYGRERPADVTDEVDFERIVAGVRATLDAPEVAAAWAAGRAMSLEQAVEDALAAEALPVAERPVGDVGGGPLSPREREVAVLVAGGLSNREIAARLVITERTAEGHVAHILDRLGFRTRVQIAAWATERGLRRGGPAARAGVAATLAVREDGRAKAPELAIAAALPDVPGRTAPAAVRAGAGRRGPAAAPAAAGRAQQRPPRGLTAREAEVLRLVAAGQTDRQIAAALVISEETVGRHLANLYPKLGVSTRAAATAAALRLGLA